MRDWLIRVALRFWPPHLRDRHGRSLAATTRAAWDACARASRMARPWRRMRLIMDLIQSGLAERWTPAAGQRRSVREVMSALAVSQTDIVTAWRSFARRPAFAAVVFLTLTLGL